VEKAGKLKKMVHAQDLVVWKNAKWTDQYAGRWYPSRGFRHVRGVAPQWNLTAADEVLSVNMERLYTSPMRLLNEDPEVFNFLTMLIVGGV
jgi:hypothetical protein